MIDLNSLDDLHSVVDDQTYGVLEYGEELQDTTDEDESEAQYYEAYLDYWVSVENMLHSKDY